MITYGKKSLFLRMITKKEGFDLVSLKLARSRERSEVLLK